MRSKHQLLLLLLVVMMMITMILTNYVAALRHSATSDDDVQVHRCSSPLNSGRADCQSSGNTPMPEATSDEVEDIAEIHQLDSGEAKALGRWVSRADRERIVDGGQLTQSKDRRRQGRSVRQTKTVELAETSEGQLFSLGSDYAERFAFKDPRPSQLDISAVMGNVLLRDGHRLDYETKPEVEFLVIVTRVDDVACEYC